MSETQATPSEQPYNPDEDPDDPDEDPDADPEQLEREEHLDRPSQAEGEDDAPAEPTG